MFENIDSRNLIWRIERTVLANQESKARWIVKKIINVNLLLEKCSCRKRFYAPSAKLFKTKDALNKNTAVLSCAKLHYKHLKWKSDTVSKQRINLSNVSFINNNILYFVCAALPWLISLKRLFFSEKMIQKWILDNFQKTKTLTNTGFSDGVGKMISRNCYKEIRVDK